LLDSLLNEDIEVIQGYEKSGQACPELVPDLIGERMAFLQMNWRAGTEYHSRNNQLFILDAPWLCHGEFHFEWEN
jgi:hypothetical protein